MKKYLIALCAAGAALLSTVAAAAGAGMSAGTTGVGAHVSVPLRDNLNARLGVNYAQYNYSGTASGVDYDFKLKLNTFDALLDFYPATGSSFRLTSGLMYNGNKVDVSAKPGAGATYTFNGNTYAAASAGRVDGRVDFRNVAPYLGIGWGNAAGTTKGWSISSDLGVMFSGKPRASLSNSGCSAEVVLCERLAADVAAQDRALNDELDKLKFYPVIRVGAAYRF